MSYIFGHRGAAGNYPENTMLSFIAARETGADGIELDVQMTKDGELVVIHDETVDRTTNGTGFVNNFTYKELAKLDASYTYSQYQGKAYIPSLVEVLEWAAESGVLLNIELKNGVIDYPGIEEKTIELIYKYKLEKNVFISSFNHYSLVDCKQISNEIETAILYMEGLYKPWEYAASIGATGLHPHYIAARKEIITQAQSSGIAVRPFTVNEKHIMKQLVESGCTAFITDYPELAVSLREE